MVKDIRLGRKAFVSLDLIDPAPTIKALIALVVKLREVFAGFDASGSCRTIKFFDF